MAQVAWRGKSPLVHMIRFLSFLFHIVLIVVVLAWLLHNIFSQAVALGFHAILNVTSRDVTLVHLGSLLTKVAATPGARWCWRQGSAGSFNILQGAERVESVPCWGGRLRDWRGSHSNLRGLPWSEEDTLLLQADDKCGHGDICQKLPEDDTFPPMYIEGLWDWPCN